MSAKDLLDLFGEGALDLDDLDPAELPTLPLSDAEDMWLAEVARRPEHLSITRIDDGHLSAHSKLLLAAIVAVQAADLPVDHETLASEIARNAARAQWDSWDRRKEMPALDLRTLPKRLHKRRFDSNLPYAEDCLIKAYVESKYINALERAAVIAREKGSAASRDFMDKVRAKLDAIQGGVKTKTIHDAAIDVAAVLDKRLLGGDGGFISSGYARADAATNGWYPRRMTGIGGWQSNGKSTLMAQLLLGMATSGTKCSLISLEDEATITVTRVLLYEMTGLETARRLSTLIPKSDTVQNGYDGYDVDGLREFARRVLASLPLLINDTARSKHQVGLAIREAARAGAKVVAIDYLQACPLEGKATKTEFYGGCVAHWKSVAQAEGVHLILGTQLRRADESRDSKVKSRPRIDMAYYCPDLEHACEYVMLVHRHQMSPEDRPDTGVEESRIILAKCKTGLLQTWTSQWDHDRAKFKL